MYIYITRYNQNDDQPTQHPPCLQFQSSHYIKSYVSK